MDLRSGTPYWRCIHEPVTPYPILQNSHTTEVLVIGSGISGALIGHALTERGFDTIIVDRGAPAGGSTGASTGLLQYEIDSPLTLLAKRMGEKPAVRAYERGLNALQALAALCKKLGLSTGFSERKSLYLASSKKDAKDLKDEYDLRKKHGFELEWLDRESLLSMSSIDAPAALYTLNAGQINPYEFTVTLLSATNTLGTKIFSNTDIKRVLVDSEGVTVESENGTIRSKYVVYATGYDSAPFLDSPKGRFHSTYVVASAPLSSTSGWPEGCLIWETSRPYFYARQTDDERVIVGGADSPYATDHERDELVEKKSKDLVKRFYELFPKISFVPEFTWAGTFGESKDGLPYIGREKNRPREFFSLGYGGNGITYSVLASQIIPDLIEGKRSVDVKIFGFER